jgi:hypothetical protein
VTSARLHGVSFDKGDGHTLVIWGDQTGQAPVSLDLGPGGLIAAVGAQLAPPSGPTTVTVGPEPQLLQTARPLADVLPR